MSGDMTAEAAVFVAIQKGDHAEARELLEDFFPSELDDVISAAETLIEYAQDTKRLKGAR